MTAMLRVPVSEGRMLVGGPGPVRPKPCWAVVPLRGTVPGPGPSARHDEAGPRDLIAPLCQQAVSLQCCPRDPTPPHRRSTQR